MNRAHTDEETGTCTEGCLPLHLHLSRCDRRRDATRLTSFWQPLQTATFDPSALRMVSNAEREASTGRGMV